MINRNTLFTHLILTDVFFALVPPPLRRHCFQKIASIGRKETSPSINAVLPVDVMPYSTPKIYCRHLFHRLTRQLEKSPSTASRPACIAKVMYLEMSEEAIGIHMSNTMKSRYLPYVAKLLYHATIISENTKFSNIRSFRTNLCCLWRIR